MTGQQVGEHVEEGLDLVIAVGGAVHHSPVGAEGHVVDKGPSADESEVDAQFDAVGERVQAGRRVVPVQAEVQREVVAGAGRDDHEGEAVSSRDAGYECLRSVAAGHAEQVRPAAHRRAR